MTRLPHARLDHLGIYTVHLEAMLAFYQRWFGMVESDRGTALSSEQVVFLTANLEQHHQLVLLAGRPPGLASTINQISFRVDDLEVLREMYRALVADDVPVLQQVDHGNTWSVYVPDPDGNRVEIYCHTPWYVPQPINWPLNLDLSTATIFERTRAMAQVQPGYQPREVWMAGIAERLRA